MDAHVTYYNFSKFNHSQNNSYFDFIKEKMERSIRQRGPNQARAHTRPTCTKWPATTWPTRGNDPGDSGRPAQAEKHLSPPAQRKSHDHPRHYSCTLSICQKAPELTFLHNAEISERPHARRRSTGGTGRPRRQLRHAQT
jgi:hypothetical protein